MALIHRARVRPTKLELIGGWLPGQGWYGGGPSAEVEALGAYRFDDPDGEVGIDSHLVRVGDQVLQVPMTYRAAPLDGAEAWLIGTTEHTVLGTRWVYDACGDPVYANALAAVVFGGGKQAEEYFEVDGRREFRTPTAQVIGTGGPDVEPVAEISCSTEGAVTTIRSAAWELRVNRVIDPSAKAGDHALTGTWAGREAPVVLANGRLL